MKIQKILSQCRRDFNTVFECEYCGHTYEGRGYDDTYFHRQVIPKIKCSECGEKAFKDYRPLTTKYPDGEQH